MIGNSRDNKNFKNKNTVYKIKVVAKDTKKAMIHDNVPFDHIEMIKVNPNLAVYILEEKQQKRYGKSR